VGLASSQFGDSWPVVTSMDSAQVGGGSGFFYMHNPWQMGGSPPRLAARGVIYYRLRSLVCLTGRSTSYAARVFANSGPTWFVLPDSSRAPFFEFKPLTPGAFRPSPSLFSVAMLVPGVGRIRTLPDHRGPYERIWLHSYPLMFYFSYAVMS